MKVHSSIYHGSFEDGVCKGFGALIDHTGSVYYGSIDKGMPEGLGIKVYKNNDVYIGLFKKGKREGLGYMHEDVKDKCVNEGKRYYRLYKYDKVIENIDNLNAGQVNPPPANAAGDQIAQPPPA